MNNRRLHTFESFKTSTSNEAFIIINESITEFMSKPEVTDVDVEKLKKVQTDVISKYDLPGIDVDTIKTRVSDAISQKIIDPKIDVNIKTS